MPSCHQAHRYRQATHRQATHRQHTHSVRQHHRQPISISIIPAPPPAPLPPPRRTARGTAPAAAAPAARGARCRWCARPPPSQGSAPQRCPSQTPRQRCTPALQRSRGSAARCNQQSNQQSHLEGGSKDVPVQLQVAGPPVLARTQSAGREQACTHASTPRHTCVREKSSSRTGMPAAAHSSSTLRRVMPGIW